MPRLCSHDICRSLWTLRDVSCYGKGTKFETHQGCFYTEERPTWIRVERVIPSTEADPQLFRWSSREPTLYRKFKSSAFYTTNLLEALTSDYGNELWSGRICLHHRNRSYKEPRTSCAVLLDRVQRAKIEALATIILVRACLELEVFETNLIDFATQGLLPRTDMPVLKLRQATHDIMEEAEPVSPRWLIARAFSLYANIFHNRDAAWMTPFSEFVTFAHTNFKSTEHVLKRHATQTLVRDDLSTAKNEALAGLIRLKSNTAAVS